jgi:hypothetical protein
VLEAPKGLLCRARVTEPQRRHGQNFSKDEIAHFKAAYAEGLKLESIARDLKTNSKSLWRLRRRLNMPARYKPQLPRPSEAQLKKLREMWAAGKHVPDICFEVGISQYWFEKLRHQVGLPVRPMSLSWTEAQKTFLIDNYGKIPIREIAARLKRTVHACYNKSSEWGLLSDAPRWTTPQVDTLLRMRREGFSYGQIGKHMGIGKNAVIGKANRLRKSGVDV